MGYYRQQRVRQFVDRIQQLTHRVTRYSVKELRNGPRRMGPAPKRQHAARLMRDWRRAKTVRQESQQPTSSRVVDV
jgi:hypothetical protein